MENVTRYRLVTRMFLCGHTTNIAFLIVAAMFTHILRLLTNSLKVEFSPELEQVKTIPPFRELGAIIMVSIARNKHARDEKP
jgi:hypothetical protein